MSRTVAALPAGSRITDYISLGVVAKTFPLDQIRAVLAVTGKESVRQRDLPAHVVVYYVIALALYMQSSYREVLRCLLEGIQWLQEPSAGISVAGNSGISQARTRLGWEPVRHLYDEVVKPIAQPSTRGAWYRDWRIVSIDGSTLDVADETANASAFGRPVSGRGEGGFPQIRFASLLENGTHVLFGGRMAGYATSETALAKTVLLNLRAGMLCLADRGFFGFPLWSLASGTGAMLLWRVRKDMRLPCEKRLPDGSYLSRTYPSQPDQKRGTNGVVLRVIEYCLEGVEGSEPIYRLVTTVLDHAKAPATGLAALYHDRWEIGVSSQGHIVQSVRDRPRRTDSSLVAGEAPWRESKTAEPSDKHTRKECAQRTRLQRAVNADVASLHEFPVAETVDNARKQQELSETSPKRQLSPAGYQRRHGVKDDVETGEALGARRRNLAEEMPAITASGKCRHRHQGGGSGRSTVDGRAAKRAWREGPGPVSNSVRQGEAGVK
jgi:hypothetical protein